MKPATRHKETIAGIPVETFSTTHKGKYVRGHRAYHQTYWRLLQGGEIIVEGDQVALNDPVKWLPRLGYWGEVLKPYFHALHRRRVGGKP